MSQGFRRLIPSLNRILVRKAEPVTQTASGLILSQEENLNIGEIVEVGPGNFDDSGRRIALSVSIGDTVLLPDFGGQIVELEGGEFHLYRDTDILGVLEE